MRKIVLIFCSVALAGCAWLGFGEDSQSSSQDDVSSTTSEPAAESAAEPAQEQTPAEPAKPAQKATRAVKGAKSEAQIKAELDAMGKKLAAQSARTLLPNRSNPEFKRVGNDWVASFIDVDTNNVRTEMRPGSNGQYVGFIRYQERFMECRGATKEAALKGSCTQVKTRNLNELIRYDGRMWQD